MDLLGEGITNSCLRCYLGLAHDVRRGYIGLPRGLSRIGTLKNLHIHKADLKSYVKIT
jgi:hypothetical protein